MKLTKYLAIALGFVAILMVVGWFLRNTIIERISNPLLGQYGLTVTDVSLDALATKDASISYLELEHMNGTTIGIEDLTLPISKSRSGFKIYTADKITIDLPADGADEPLNLAQVLNQLLALPQQLPQTEIIVTELSVPPYPAIRDLRWQLTTENQQLTTLVASISLTANIARTSDTSHLLDLSFTDTPGTVAVQSIMVEFLQTDAGISLNGTSTLDLPLWMPVAALLGVTKIDVISGSARLRFDSEIADDEGQTPFMYADLTPTTPLQIAYSRAADAITSITLETASPIEISASFPDVQWDLRQAQATLVISDGDWHDIPVSLINLSCQSGPACSTDIGIVMENAALPFANVNQFELAATQDISISQDGIKVTVHPNATLGMIGISNPDLELARINAQLTSTAEMDVGDTGWQFEAQSVDVDIEEYAVLDGVTFSAPVFLDDVSISDSSGQMFVKVGVYASSSHANWDDQLIQLPGFTGGISRQGAEVAVILTTAGLHKEASIEAFHNLDNVIGRLSLIGTALSFDTQKVSSRISPWPGNWDIAAGTVALDLQADWQKTDSEWQLVGQTLIQMTDLAGAYNDTVFAGLSTSLEASFDDTTGLVVDPSKITVGLVELGLPIENITADYTLHPNEKSVDVQNLRMNAFGGVVTADPFSFRTASDSNTLLLHAESIDLAEILSIKEFESVEISGSIGAELPVTIEGKTVTIVGGTLTGEPPGGVIRYLPGMAGNNIDTSALGIATRALSNFKYETLTSEVAYTRDGDLNLQMHLTGRNPDLEDNRPVVLNLGLENNVPQMLRSLQASRAVADILEKRLAQ